MSERGSQELEAELKVFRRGMAKALRAGNDAQLQELAATYARLKDAHAAAVVEERMARVRAARAAQGAQRPVPVRRGLVAWSRGRFGRSPGAYERDRLPPEPEKPQIPYGGHLSPWRRSGSPSSEVIWKP